MSPSREFSNGTVTCFYILGAIASLIVIMVVSCISAWLHNAFHAARRTARWLLEMHWSNIA